MANRTITVLCSNIGTSKGKILKGEKVTLPAEEVRALIDMDKEAGRAPRIKPIKRGTKRENI